MGVLYLILRGKHYMLLTGPLPRQLAALIHLEVMSVNGNRLHGTLVALCTLGAQTFCTKLVIPLDLGPLPKEFSAMSRLKRLNLCNNQFSGSLLLLFQISGTFDNGYRRACGPLN